MKNAVILLSLLLAVGFVNAQNENPKHPCFRVSSFSSSFGFAGALTSNSNEDYYILKDAVNDPGLFVDITGLSNDGSGWYYGGMNFSSYGSFNSFGSGSGNGSLLINLGLTPYCKKLGKYKENAELRFSLGGNIGTRNNFYYYDNNSFVIDTFQSVNGTGTVYADSIIAKQYTYSLDFSEINFGVSYLFKTDVNRIVHFYTGAGFNYGITLRSSVSFYEDTYKSVYYYNSYDNPPDDQSYYYTYGDNYTGTYKSSNTNLKNPMQFVRVYIPLGISIRLSKKPSSFFSHTNLYAEMNPGVEFQFLSQDKTYANPYFGFAFIGFNYHW
jgi:hypothetical protein